MKTYPSYKDSGVEWIGKVPSNWKCKRLKYLDKTIMGHGSVFLISYKTNQTLHLLIPPKLRLCKISMFLL